MKNSILKIAVLTTLLVAVATPEAARGDTDLRSELRTVAKSITRLLQSKQLDSIAIGEFTGPPTFASSAGAGIVQILTEEFEKLGVQVKKRAKIGLKGEYAAAKVTKQSTNNSLQTFETVAVRIKGSLVDDFGEVITDFNLTADTPGEQTKVDKGKFSTDIEGEENFVHLIGTNVKLPPTDRRESDRANRLKESFTDPEDPSNLRIVAGTKLFAGPGSPYGLEILAGTDQTNTTPAKLRVDVGLPQIKLNRGEIYQVRLYNNSDFEAAVKLTIDGLNVFTFSDIRETSGPRKGEPKYSVYVIQPHSSTTLLGWHRTNAKVDSFLVTSYENSAAAKLGHKSNLGTITASFSAAWPIDQPPPADEPGFKKSGPNATGFGPPVEQVVKEVRRHIGVMRAALSVR